MSCWIYFRKHKIVLVFLPISEIDMDRSFKSSSLVEDKGLFNPASSTYLQYIQLIVPQWYHMWHRSMSTLDQVVAYCWWHKTMTWTNVIFSLIKFCGIHMRALSQMPKFLFYDGFKSHIQNKYCHISEGPLSWQNTIESIKTTTSMEDVSTRVLEKLKNI